jgi:hypothetical protein
MFILFLVLSGSRCILTGYAAQAIHSLPQHHLTGAAIIRGANLTQSGINGI